MLIDIIKEQQFQEMMDTHISDLIFYFLENEQPFGLLCNIKYVTFDPPLPDELFHLLKDVTLFMIAGYTLESFEIEDDTITFEAGFGPQNFGSVVRMPTLAILQLLVEDTPVLINMAQPMVNLKTKEQEAGIKTSLENFLNNPENRKFLKK